MHISLILTKLLLTFSAIFGVGYGIRHIRKEKMPPYFYMVVYGMICGAMGRIFEILHFFLMGESSSGFQIGIFGVTGSILFFFTANYGPMDLLGDDGSAIMRPGRILGGIAPVVILVLYGIILSSPCSAEQKAVSAMIAVDCVFAGYYHLKHILIPDIEEGLIRNLRVYNFLALFYELLCMGERIAFALQADALFFIWVYLFMGVTLFMLLPALYMGVKRWTM